MRVAVYETIGKMSEAAAATAAEELARCIAEKERATFIAATGTSQLRFLDTLTRQSRVDWTKTEMYHLDEYVGLPESHPASFRRYLRERLLNVVHPGRVHLIDGNAPDPWSECARLEQLVPTDGFDIAFVGIGENAHLAFNDPPADFANDALFTVVELSETYRAQQIYEGWFKAIKEVPDKAITMTIQGILRAKVIICVVPQARKADAVRCALTGAVRPACPASALRDHPRVSMFLDADAASLLDKAMLERCRKR
jgi:glucosamine-6-phosphate deaminase